MSLAPPTLKTRMLLEVILTITRGTTQGHREGEKSMPSWWDRLTISTPPFPLQLRTQSRSTQFHFEYSSFFKKTYLPWTTWSYPSQHVHSYVLFFPLPAMSFPIFFPQQGPNPPVRFSSCVTSLVMHCLPSPRDCHRAPIATRAQL